MKTLFVDGPLAGKVEDFGGRVYVAVPQVPTDTYLGIPQARTEAPRELVYTVHRYAICGRMLWLASLESDPTWIDQAKVFDLIASPTAKLVAQ